MRGIDSWSKLFVSFSMENILSDELASIYFGVGRVGRMEGEINIRRNNWILILDPHSPVGHRRLTIRKSS